MATRSRRSSKTKSNPNAWDFSQEESGGGGKRFKEGDYLVKCIKAKPGTSENKGTPFIEFTFKFMDGKYKGKTFEQRLYNTPKALWLTRSFIEAVGEEVPGKGSNWKTIARLVLKQEVVVTLTDNHYESDDGTERTSSQVSDFIDPDEWDEDEANDDEDDFDDEDDDDLDDEIDEDEDDEEDDDELEDDEDEDEEPEPRRKKRTRSKSKTKKSKSRRRKSTDDDDDDLEDIDLDDV